MPTHEEWLAARIVPWAITTEAVRAVAEIGSRTHDTPADEWADMDLLLLVTDTSAVLDSDDWIAEIGPHWLSLRHPGPFRDLPVRQVLFEGALDFDVIPMQAGTLGARLRDPHVMEAIGGGLRSVVDKDGELAGLDMPPRPLPLSPEAITRGDFDFVVQDFLFQTVWATKHLRRGELWAAKDDVDGYMKVGLARMIEWHTVAIRPGTRTRSGGRYLERWADPSIVSQLPSAFATYDPRAVAEALLASATLFRRIATETAKALGFEYPTDRHDLTLGWVEACLAPLRAHPR